MAFFHVIVTEFNVSVSSYPEAHLLLPSVSHTQGTHVSRWRFFGGRVCVWIATAPQRATHLFGDSVS